jgi:hypothetical protein
MTIQVRNVAKAISELNVEGLIIKDIDEIPAEVGQRSPAVLIPLPDFIGEFSMVRDSYGGGSSAAMTVNYTLGYRLLFQPIGTSRAMSLVVFLGLTEMIGLIWDAVLAIDVLDTDFDEVVDLVPTSITNMGIVNDPADNVFYGCDMTFEVTEFVN